MTFGDYLKELRQEKGLSQKELSGLTKGQVSNAEISRLEAGVRKKPSPAVLKILAPHLGVPVEALLTQAGYMDDLPSGIAQDGFDPTYGESSGQDLDGQQLARLQFLEEESIGLKKVNQELLQEAEALKQRCSKLEAENKELDDKSSYLLRHAAPADQAGGAWEQEIQALREKNEGLQEENRRIKAETIVFLDEGTSLRAEAENYRKKMNQAEEALRKAKQVQEDLEEELSTLREQAAEALAKGGDELEEKSKNTEEERLAWQQEVDALAAEKVDLANKLDDAERGQRELLGKLDELDQEKSELAARLSELELERSEWLGKTDKLEEQLRGLLEKENINEENQKELDDAKGEIAEKEKEAADLRAQLSAYETQQSTHAEEIAGLHKKIEDIEGQLEEASSKQEQLVRDNLALAQEISTAKDEMNTQTTVMGLISGYKIDDMDLGSIFSETVKEASQDDLETLSRLMLAMRTDAIRSSDKRMLMDILKRFVK